ncbi:hypothetical protein LZ30DRAFT_719923 [Colletotrichum cereale]|nr:hypothetical protein LZ30DRAFT_719923 [Colletotrichum cereale]
MRLSGTSCTAGRSLLGIAETVANVQVDKRMFSDLGSLVHEDVRLLAVSAGEGEETARHARAEERGVPRHLADDVHNPASALETDNELAVLAESRRLLGGNLPQDNDLVGIVSRFRIAPVGATWDKCRISKDDDELFLKQDPNRAEESRHSRNGACGEGPPLLLPYIKVEKLSSSLTLFFFFCTPLRTNLSCTEKPRLFPSKSTFSSSIQLSNISRTSKYSSFLLLFTGVRVSSRYLY